jgi:16S rRNA (cytosine967-C5)-methyltransferase
MKKSSLLGHAAEVVALVRDGRRPADAVIADFFRERRYLGARDRREISAMVFGTIRHYRRVDDLARAAFAEVPDSGSRQRACLMIAAYVLHLAGDTSADTPEALREFLVTGLGPDAAPKALEHLRMPVSEDAAVPTVERIARKRSFPDVIIREWLERWGETETDALAAALNEQAPLSVRVNTLRGTVDQCRRVLADAGVAPEPGALSPFALVLPRRIALDTLPPYRDGWFEMQDEGSQILSLLVHPEPGATVIDACAGGGGKTLHLAALMENRGQLVAVDTDDRKLLNLVKRAERAGAHVHAVLSAWRDEAALRRYRGKAHAVLVDAPCSAIGTTRRNPWLKMSYVQDRSLQLTATQNALLDAAAEWVAPGGRLVYSTCTLLRSENDDVVARFLESHAPFSLQPAYEVLARWGIAADRACPYLELFPHRHGTDGFFAAVMVKEEAPASVR